MIPMFNWICLLSHSESQVVLVDNISNDEMFFIIWILFYNLEVLLFEMLSEQGKCLTIKPAGIVMTKSGIEWIQSNTLDKHAWFQMFYRDIDTLHCDVQIKVFFAPFFFSP